MTVNGMTGLANVAGECGGKRINSEVRAVNHRYLDVQFRMPDDLRHPKGTLREQIAAQAARGKLKCHTQAQDVAQGTQGLDVNQGLVVQLADLNKLWHREYGFGKLSVAKVLKFPGVLAVQTEDAEAFAKAVQALLARALKEFAAARKREGKKLGERLLRRLDGVEEIVNALGELFSSLLQAHVDKVSARLAKAVGNIDNDRLQQESAPFIQESDADEELSRLRAHIAEVRRIVTEGKSSADKHLDFLMQGLNREVNTLGNKAIAAECTQVPVELEMLIKQIRERVQNIE